MLFGSMGELNCENSSLMQHSQEMICSKWIRISCKRSLIFFTVSVVLLLLCIGSNKKLLLSEGRLGPAADLHQRHFRSREEDRDADVSLY